MGESNRLTNRINIFTATMENYDNVLKYTTESEEAAGTSAQKYTAYMESTQAHLNQLTATWEKFVAKLDASGAFNKLIDIGAKLIDVLDYLLNDLGILDNIAIPAVLTYLAGSGASKIISQVTDIAGVISNLSKGYTVAESATTGFASVLAKVGSEAVSSGTQITGLGSMLKVLISNINGVGLAVGGVAAIVAGAYIAGQVHQQKIQEILDTTNEAAEAYQSEQKTIEDLIDEYEGLNEQLEEAEKNNEDTQDIKGQLLTLQGKIVDALGDEADGLAIVNGKYEEQLEEINEIIRSKARLYVSDNKKAYDVASEDMSTPNQFPVFTDDDVDFDADALASRLKLAMGDAISTVENADGGFLLDINFETGDAETTLNKLRDEVEAYGKEAGVDVSSIVERISEIYDSFDMSDIQEKNNIIETQQIAMVNSSEVLQEKYQALKSAVSDYNDALASGDPTQIENARLVLQGAESDAQQIANEMPVAFQAVVDGIDTSSEQYNAFVEDLRNQTPEAIANITESLQGFTNTELLAVTGTNTLWENLVAQAESYGITVSELLGILEELGYISEEQATGISSVNEELSNLSDYAQELASEDWFSDWESALEDGLETDDVEEWIETFGEAGYTIEEVIEHMEEFGDITEDELNQAEQAVADFNMEQVTTALDDAISTLANVDTNFQTLTSAVEEFNTYGAISASTLKSLTDNNLIQYLSQTANGMSVNTDALLTDAEAVRANAIEQVKLQAYLEMVKLAEDDTSDSAVNSANTSVSAGNATEAAGKQFAAAAPGMMSAAEAMEAWVAAYSGSGKIDTAEKYAKFNDIVNRMNASISMISSVSYKAAGSLGGLGSSASSAGSGMSSAADSAKELKEALEDAQDAIEDYIDLVVKMIKQDLKSQKEVLQKKKETLKDEYDALVDTIDAEKDAMDDYYEDLKDQYDREKELAERNFEDRKDQINALKDAQEDLYDEQEDALKKELDAYKEKIEAEKELLKQKQKEADYEKDLADKVKSVAAIQSDLAKLQFDDSLSAQKKKISLMEELADAQEELDDLQADRNEELQEDALDAELDRYEKAYNDRIDKLDEEKKAFEKMIDAELDALDKEKTQYERDYKDKIYMMEEEKKQYTRNVEQRKTEAKEAYEYEKSLLEQQIDDIEDQLDKEGELVQQAIKMIDEDAEGTYERLLEWNDKYGTGITKSVPPIYSNVYCKLHIYAGNS
jgi:hypothetical protein